MVLLLFQHVQRVQRQRAYLCNPLLTFLTFGRSVLTGTYPKVGL